MRVRCESSFQVRLVYLPTCTMALIYTLSLPDVKGSDRRRWRWLPYPVDLHSISLPPFAMARAVERAQPPNIYTYIYIKQSNTSTKPTHRCIYVACLRVYSQSKNPTAYGKKNIQISPIHPHATSSRGNSETQSTHHLLLGRISSGDKVISLQWHGRLPFFVRSSKKGAGVVGVDGMGWDGMGWRRCKNKYTDTHIYI